MEYQDYFDSLFDKDLYKEKDEIFGVLLKENQNPIVKSYDGLNEIVFELLMALHEEDDYMSILKLKELLKENYEEVFDAECGQFADILIPHYISLNQDKEAKSIFEEWCTKDYDYDSILVSLNRLAYYGKENWIAEYITKEYDKVKTSSKLISGAEEDLAVYKVMIEIGKFISGISMMKKIEEELSKYEITMSELHKKVLESDEKAQNFNKEKRSYVFNKICEFQKYLNNKYNIPYLTSGVIMESLTEYYENSKYEDAASYFKIDENSFDRYMYNNSVNGLSFNIESNFAMLYILPIQNLFLKENGIFTETEENMELKKVENLSNKYKVKYSRISEIFNKLKIYNSITAANKSYPT